MEASDTAIPKMVTVGSRKLEYGFRMMYAGFPSFFCFGIGRRSYSNFLASTVKVYSVNLLHEVKGISLSVDGYDYYALLECGA